MCDHLIYAIVDLNTVFRLSLNQCWFSQYCTRSSKTSILNLILIFQWVNVGIYKESTPTDDTPHFGEFERISLNLVVFSPFMWDRVGTQNWAMSSFRARVLPPYKMSGTVVVFTHIATQNRQETGYCPNLEVSTVNTWCVFCMSPIPNFKILL